MAEVTMQIARCIQQLIMNHKARFGTGIVIAHHISGTTSISSD